MDFRFTGEQEIFRNSTRSFLEKKYSRDLMRESIKEEREFSSELWQQIADLGWLGIAIPESYGGSELGFQEMTILFEEVGRACFMSPLFSTAVLGGLLILQMGNENQKKDYLEKIAQGEKQITLALCEPNFYYNERDITTKATKLNDKYVIEGTKLFVPYARTADFIICAAKFADFGTSLFICSPSDPGMKISWLKTIAGDGQYEVNFDKVQVSHREILGELDSGWPALKRLLSRASLIKSAEMLGGAEKVLEMCVEYVKIREQFGKPIGSLQAIQHYCADMHIDLSMAKNLVYKAAWTIDEGHEGDLEIAMAKALSSDAYRKTTLMGHQIHGAIAFCEEHDMYLYMRHAKACEINYGDATFQRNVVANHLFANR